MIGVEVLKRTASAENVSLRTLCYEMWMVVS